MTNRTRLHRLRRKLVDTPQTADKNAKSADRQKLKRLEKDLGNYTYLTPH